MKQTAQDKLLLFCLFISSIGYAGTKSDAAPQSFADYILSPFNFLLASATPSSETTTSTEKFSDAVHASPLLSTDNISTATHPVMDEAKKDNDVETKAPEAGQVQEIQATAIGENVQQNVDKEQNVELQFENADLSIFVAQIAEIFQITFLADDMFDPLPQDGRSIKGNKITFKTHHPLSKKEVWDIFLSIMDTAKFAVIPQQELDTYRIVPTEKAKKNVLSTYIGVAPETLPDNDEIIRYVYYVENTNLDVLKPIIDSLRSPVSDFVLLKSSRAFVLTDRAYNIRMLMKIVHELDKILMPETLSVLKLRYADAKQVADLLQNLVGKEGSAAASSVTKRQPTALYFPEGVRIIPEARTNTLILLGPRDAIAKIEDFVVQHVDITLEQPYAPFFVYELKYADAETIAEIMNNATQFGKDTDVGKVGGVRGNDQYLGPLLFVAEKETNRIIVKGSYEDFMQAKVIMDKLDEAQPQIALEILVVSITVTDNLSLGAQLRSKQPGPGILGTNVNFQTSGLFGTSGIQQNANAAGQNTILGNLVNLVVGASAGNTIISMGQDMFGVWGILQVLQSITNVEVVANPFFTVTNKTPATVFLGQERRVVTATVSGVETVNSFGKDQAKLEVNATPQINSDGKVVLQVHVTDNDFSDVTDFTSGTKDIREVQTSLIMADGDIAALGGIIRDQISLTVSKVPFLGDIPILGWFFKNEQKAVIKTHLLILIGVDIVGVGQKEKMQAVTNRHLTGYYSMMDAMESAAIRKDPIHKTFFGREDKTEKLLENLIFERHKRPKTPTRNKRLRAHSKKRKREWVA